MIPASSNTSAGFPESSELRGTWRVGAGGHVIATEFGARAPETIRIPGTACRGGATRALAEGDRGSMEWRRGERPVEVRSMASA
jgi:hypothetical protein